MPTINIIRTRQDIATKLKEAGIDDPLREAAYLLSAALHITRGELLALDELDLTDDQAARLVMFITRRVGREPLARIVGEKEFWGLPFRLNNHTLVPRPDTEILVQTVLDAVPDKTRPLRILDLGTGSGCILLALLHELPGATGVGVDLAPQAVQQATENAAALRLSDRAQFIVSDWLADVTGMFDIIVSNPPYIAPAEEAGLMPEVRAYDPPLALYAAADGLAAYDRLIDDVGTYLNSNGILAFEVGAGQAEPVKQRLLAKKMSADVAEIKDLAGIYRVIMTINRRI